MIDIKVGAKFVVTYDMHKTNKCSCRAKCCSHIVIITDIENKVVYYRAVNESFESSTDIHSLKICAAANAVYDEYNKESYAESFYGSLKSLLEALVLETSKESITKETSSE